MPSKGCAVTAPGETLVHVYRLLIVDDHPIVRHGVSQLIDAEPDLEVCGEVGSMDEALRLMETSTPDAAIVDISLEDESGLRLIQEILARRPEVRILVYSVHEEATYAPRALQAGAAGYIEKREPLTAIVQAVRRILEGKVYVSPGMANRLLHQAVSARQLGEGPTLTLSAREFEVFEMIGRGMTVKQIARKLGVSPKTVESHRQKIKDKLSLKNSTQLSRYAFDWVRRQT